MAEIRTSDLWNVRHTQRANKTHNIMPILLCTQYKLCSTFSLLLRHRDSLHQNSNSKKWSYSTLVTEGWARNWSWCTGSQPAGDFLSHPPAVGCHYFPPGLQSPSQPTNVTVLRPIPSYTAWWQRHIRVNNLPKVVTQLCPRGN